MPPEKRRVVPSPVGILYTPRYPLQHFGTIRPYLSIIYPSIRTRLRPAPMPPEKRAAALATLTKLMGDANLVFDRHLQVQFRFARDMPEMVPRPR